MKTRQVARKVSKPTKKGSKLPKAKKKPLDLASLHDSIMQLSEDDKIRFRMDRFMAENYQKS